MTTARKHPLDKVRVGEGRPGSWFVWQSGYWGTQVAEGPFDTKEAADRAAVTVRRAIRTKGRTPIKRNATTIVVVGSGHHKNPSQRKLRIHRLRSRVVARINPPRDKRGRFVKRRR